VVNFSFSACVVELGLPQVVTVVDITSAILSRSQVYNLSLDYSLRDPEIQGGCFYYAHAEAYIPLTLREVRRVPQIELLNAASPTDIISRDYSVFIFDGVFPIDVPPIIKAAPGQEVAVVACPFGCLSREVFRNTVTRAVVSETDQACVSLIDYKYLPGTSGAAVYSADCRSMVGVVLPTALPHVTPVLNLDYFTEVSTAPRPAFLRSIVLIYAGFSSGTGVVVAPNCIFTAAHVVKGFREVTVVIEGVHYKATVQTIGAVLDFALISTVQDFSPLSMNLQPTAGERVLAVGFALKGQIAGLHPLITQGTLSKVVLYKDLPTLLLTSALILNGHSGGALLDSSHRLIGVISSNVKLKKQIFPHCNLSVSCTAFYRPELITDSSEYLAELQNYETVRELPKYRPKL
jgi:S1-C subfamily serine protease